MAKTLEGNEFPTSSNIFTSFAEWKVGVVPLPLYLVLAAVIFAASVYNKLPADMIGGFAVIMVMGILLGDLGQRIPILKNVGGPAILSLMVPSILVFYNVLNPASMKAITSLMKTSNFLYLYISCLVAGSILGMNRKVLAQGIVRMFVPLVVGTLAAVVVGCLAGALFGFGIHHTFFYIVVPILGGGIGEGILPLSLGYGEILHKTSESMVSMMVPAAVIGNIVAVICAGLLKRLGEKRPHLTGNGMLVKTGDDTELLKEQNQEKPVEFPLMGAGLLIACSFFIFGNLMNTFIGIPGTIIMIFAAALVKYLRLMPAKMEQGAHQLYKFVSSSLTWPLMVGLGVLYIPLKDVVHIITLPYVIVVTLTVLAMVSSGWLVGKLLNMYPVEAATVTVCHSGLGGTGDVAILSAAGHMELMPFAQISTRIGGATMVLLATLLLKMFH